MWYIIFVEFLFSKNEIVCDWMKSILKLRYKIKFELRNGNVNVKLNEWVEILNGG